MFNVLFPWSNLAEVGYEPISSAQGYEISSYFVLFTGYEGGDKIKFRWAGCVARMADMRILYSFIDKSEGNLGQLVMGERIILKC